MPEGVSYHPAAPTNAFHFAHRANPNQTTQPDYGDPTSVRMISIAGCVAHRKYKISFRFKIKPHYFISFTDLNIDSNAL